MSPTTATRDAVSATNGDHEDEAPASKRRRVALACNACRIRKSRCNGVRPKCSLCSNLGFDCQYEPTDSSTNVIVKKEYVSDVDTRLKLVESLLQRHEDLLRGHLSECAPNPGPGASHASHTSQPSTSPAKHAPSNSRDSIQIYTTELDEGRIAEESLTDGMALSFVDEMNTAFFGPSSNIAFTRHVLRAMARSVNQPKPPPTHRSGSMGGMLDYSRAPTPTLGTAEKGKEWRAKDSLFELPEVEEMEDHISLFFRNTGVLFPFIHQPTFMKTYNEFKASGFTTIRQSWLGLLNMVMAMGSVWLWSAPEDAIARDDRANRFYERAVALTAKFSVRGPSLDVVQYLLLASQYLQGTQKSSQTWTLHGLAVKGAFAIGLHSNQASRQSSPLDNEIRKRTWFGCILLDRVLSMTFGRPPSIPEDFIRMPPAEPWPDLSPSFPLADLQLPSMNFFNASVRLHRLIGVAISRLYDLNLGYDALLSEAESIPRIIQLDQELEMWKSTLNPELSIVWSTNLPASTTYHDRSLGRFRVMLTLRYQNLNILVHRPLLCKALDQISQSSMEFLMGSISEMSKHSMTICLSSAEETIDIVHGVLTDHGPGRGSSMLGAWWFTVYYLFNAALVVFSHSLIQRALPPRADNVQQSARDIEHLNRAVAAFRLLDRNNRVVDRCTEYIEYLTKIAERQLQPQQLAGAAAVVPGLDGMGSDGRLPDLNDFLNGDLELAQYFASGIFDVQNSYDGLMGGFQ